MTLRFLSQNQIKSLNPNESDLSSDPLNFQFWAPRCKAGFFLIKKIPSCNVDKSIPNPSFNKEGSLPLDKGGLRGICFTQKKNSSLLCTNLPYPLFNKRGKMRIKISPLTKFIPQCGRGARRAGDLLHTEKIFSYKKIPLLPANSHQPSCQNII